MILWPFGDYNTLRLVIFDFGNVFVANDGGGVDAAGVEFVADVDDLLRRKRWAGAGDAVENGSEFGLRTDVTVGREVIDNFEGDIATKNYDGIKWYDGAKNRGDGGDMGGVLADGAVKLVLVFAVSGNLSPVNAVAVAKYPAEVAFGLKDENSPFVDGEAIDLEEFGVGDDVIFDVARIGVGVGFGKIAIDDDILGVEDFLKAKN